MIPRDSQNVPRGLEISWSWGLSLGSSDSGTLKCSLVAWLLGVPF